MFTYTADELALAAAVIASPTDDLPRLVMADKLEENAGSVKCGTCGGTKVAQWSCRVCGAVANGDAEVHHGRGCYRLSEDGGGVENLDLDKCVPCNGSGWVPDGRAARADFIRVSCQLPHADKCLNCRVGDRKSCFVPTCQTMVKHRMVGLFSLNAGFEDLGNIVQRIGIRTPQGLTTMPSGNHGDHRSGVFWWRGFIEFVRCPFVVWYGGLASDSPRGTRTPDVRSVAAIGPAIAAAHPVYVDCPDKRPHWNGTGYAWFNEYRRSPSDVVPASAVLPLNLFRHLGEVTGASVGDRFRSWLTPEEARDAFSVAAVAWARDEFRNRSQ